MGKAFNPLKINDLSSETGLSKKDFYESIGTSYSTVRAWLKSPSCIKVTDLVRICNIYNKDLSYFIYDPNDKKDSTSRDVNIVITNLSRELVTIVKQYEKQISALNLEHQKEINKKEMEIQRLKFALYGTGSSDSGVHGDKAAEDKEEYKTKQ